MARTFRYYGKKRGDRRTGSSTLGRAGELLFYALFLAVGCGALVVLFAVSVIPQWRVNNEFVEHTCIVLEKRVGQTKGEDAASYRPEFRIKYAIDGEDYLTWTYDIRMAYSSNRRGVEEILGQFAITADPARPHVYPCWYDPLNPEAAVLVRRSNWWIWLVFIVPVSFILIGGGGLIYRVLHWGKSTERQAAMARRTAGHDLFDTNGGSERRLPNVPRDADITNSPGTTLRFRLPIGTSPGWTLFGILIACVLWNGVVSVAIVIATRGHLGGKPDWFLTLFIVPFLAVGIGLIVIFIRQLLVTTGIGPTMVEISDHPLARGGQYRLFVSQAGRLHVNALTVSLVCEEKATYRQGTDTRTETREVLRQPVYRREGIDVRRGLPFEAECELAVPAGAMHSFKAGHNEVNWNVEVEGDVVGWPDYRRAFPLMVHPGNAGTGS